VSEPTPDEIAQERARLDALGPPTDEQRRDLGDALRHMERDGTTEPAMIHRDQWGHSLREWWFDGPNRRHFDRVVAQAQQRRRRGIVPGGWLLETPDELPVVWGEQRAPLAIEGEGLMIAGPPGVGKTTILQQLVLALAGLRETCLGLPVKRERGKVLYLAMDRPEQIRRSWARMVAAGDRELLDERVVLHLGPLPWQLVDEPERLAAMAREHGASHVACDSYKDLHPALDKPEIAAKINSAVQHVIAEGFGWSGAHHNRKATSDNRHPKRLDDVFGGVWLTAGLGSVISVYGESGDELVEARHLKQPAESFGTFGIRHDHAAGRSSLVDAPDGDPRKVAAAVRRGGIVELLHSEPERTFATTELASKFDVGASTIKRDMAALDRQVVVVDGGGWRAK